MVSFEPEAVTICCSFVPENCPNTADVIDDGGCIVKLYMNIELVVAMMAGWPGPADRMRDEGQIAEGYREGRVSISRDACRLRKRTRWRVEISR